jgi:HK97 gp10 family phage protein
VRTEITGTKEAQKALESASDEIKAALIRAVEETARAVQAEARRQVPVDTGNLRSAISVRMKSSNAEVFVDTVKAHYGHIVEFGSRSRPAKPFMGPAAELERSNFKKRVAKAAKDV